MIFEDAIRDPRINIFDILPVNGTYKAFTYRKPNETDADFYKRDLRNQSWAKRLKQKGRV